VLDTTCRPLAGYVARLTAGAACEIVSPSTSPIAQSADEGSSVIENRMLRLSRQVTDCGAHFGLWVSGDGEGCCMVDERGVRVDDERLCAKLVDYVCCEMPAPTLVLREDAVPCLESSLIARGAHIVRSRATREAMFSVMERSGAVFGCPGAGQFWFAGTPAAPDALMVVCLLLTIFSQSDQPVSEALRQS
jgi:phosphomannomutase